MSTKPIDETTKKRVRLLLDMIRIRVLEERCAELYGQRKIGGFLHLYVGEEAVAAGVISQLAEDDAIVATYREHGHALLRGVGAGRIMAELFGKAIGCSGGRGGSMHLFDVARRFFGGNAIVGGHLPLAVGLALGDTMAGHPHRVTACFFGEGAIAEGDFHEAMNLAALWNLPVLFCCENNDYAMGTSLASSQSQSNLSARAASYGMRAWRADGMDAEAVAESTRDALAAIRDGGGPVFIEFRTYRFRGHSMFDPELYRDASEVDLWEVRDPIKTMSQRLLLDGEVTGEQIDEMWADANEEVDDAVDFAEIAPVESVETLFRHVYAPQAARDGSRTYEKHRTSALSD